MKKTNFSEGKWFFDTQRKAYKSSVIGLDDLYIPVKVKNQVGTKIMDTTVAHVKVKENSTSVTNQTAEANARLICASKTMFYYIVIEAYKKGEVILFEIIKEVTGVDYDWGQPKFEKLYREAREYYNRDIEFRNQNPNLNQQNHEYNSSK